MPVSLFWRLRGATAERRHQIRWVAFAGGLAVALYILTNVTPGSPSGVALGLLLYLIKPDVVGLLWKRPLGIKMLYGGVTEIILGALIVRKIVSIRV